ncbi:MAG: hypothetical protein FJ010_09610 [Chloroflexi bacterium]|nr:hypothetical protein [Chloroflexota bacterium]
MPVRVLITTNIRSLGELMQQALQETGRYRVELSDGAEQAVERAQAERFAVAIVDFGALSDPLELIANLREITPAIRVVAMPSSADEEKTTADRSVVDAWLSMPFYLPNLIDTLAAIGGDPGVESKQAPEPERPPFPSTVPKKTVSPQPAPEWLQDVNRVAQHLTRLSLESAAQAALITRGSQLWAYAGQLPQPAAEELARAVGHYWAHDGGSDLARFIRLDATNSEYMMYATSLGGDYVLALAFETEMPFTEMRTHAGELARKLSAPPVDDTAARRADSISKQLTALEEMTLVGEPAVVDNIGEDLPPIPTDWRPDQDVAEGRQAFFEDLLASMDIPQPDGVENGAPLPLVEDREAALDFSLADTHPTPVVETRMLLEEQAPVRKSRPRALEPETSTLHNLTYACVLVPRMPQHHLVGDLAASLSQWVVQLSLAFGWRLEHLAIRPDYLHWIAVVPPNSSPGMMVHNIRQETAKHIFSEFPRLERENPSGEFWASGYLIVNGRDAFSRQMVQEFIGSVRTRQGVQ